MSMLYSSRPQWYGTASRWKCNECNDTIGTYDVRYCCLECSGEDTFDLCQECFEKTGTRHDLNCHRIGWTHPETGKEQHTVLSYWTKMKMPGDELFLSAIKTGASSIETVRNSCAAFSDRPCLGERAYVLLSSGQKHFLPFYTWITYETLWNRVRSFASGLLGIGAHSRDFVGICGQCCIDWCVADFAALYNSMVSVPIQTTMMVSDVELVINETELRCIVVAAEQLPLIVSCLTSGNCGKVKRIVIMNIRDGISSAIATEQLAALASSRPDVEVFQMADLEYRGAKEGIKPFRITNGTDLVSLCYTSGSTGRPKGAMFDENLWSGEWKYAFNETFPIIRANYLPLSHMSGRNNIMATITNGARVGFTSNPDMSNLFEDYRLIRPTNVSMVPRVCGMIYQHFQAEVIRIRLEKCIPDDAEEEIKRIRRQVLRNMQKSFLGDRVRTMSTGTAPTPKEIQLFLRRCFKRPLFEGYGSTEVASITFERRVRTDVKYRLEDAPELSYLSTDKPYPRGELLVKTKSTISGYYRNEEATKEQFVDGYFRTGDIVEDRGNGELILIDRRKAILKLAQGEFVSPARLELLYTTNSTLIQQMYIYGTSVRSFLVALVVPVLANVIAGRPELSNVTPESISDEQLQLIKQIVRADINRIAAQEGAAPYERPREILLEFEAFSAGNGLLTESNKICRPRIKEKYQKRLESLCDEIEKNQTSMLEDLAADQHLHKSAPESIEERVLRAIKITLGVCDISMDHNFTHLGGDSLAAVRLSSLIKQFCGVAVQPSMVMSPATSLAKIVEIVSQSANADQSNQLDASGISLPAPRSQEQGDAPQQSYIRAEEIRWTNFVPDASNLLPSISDIDRAKLLSEQPRCVFLTGATGFLGKYLLRELLQQLPASSTVICLVRANDDVAALKRLEDVYSCSGPLRQLAERTVFSSGRVSVLAGDLNSPLLGLKEETYNLLSQNVDAILHNGFLVNHLFTYQQLFDSNVVGTMRLIQLALTGKHKMFHFVSSVSAFGGIYGKDTIEEDVDMAQLCPSKSTASGYGTSKWVAELLLRQVHERFGIPVRIYRPTMIFAHSEFGDANISDWLIRLICSCARASLLPPSFYINLGGTETHFDALPADFVAKSIVSLAIPLPSGPITMPYTAFNVINEQPKQGPFVSLDVLLDWLCSSPGVNIATAASYQEWYDKLNQFLLKEEQTNKHKQSSLLPLMDRWARQMHGGGRSPLVSTKFRQQLSRHGLTVPQLNAALVEKCVNFLRQNGYLTSVQLCKL